MLQFREVAASRSIDPETGRDRGASASQAGLNLNPVVGAGRQVGSPSSPTARASRTSSCTTSQIASTTSSRTCSAAFRRSPSTARRSPGRVAADRMAFTYYESGDYTVWTMDNPRSLKTVAFSGTGTTSTGLATNTPLMPSPTRSWSRCRFGPPDRQQQLDLPCAGGLAPSAVLSPGEAQAGEVEATTVAVLNSNPDFALPDTTRFRDYAYSVGFKPDYIAQPEVGYATGNSTG